MGKRPQRHSWPVAKKRCRLNQLDIEMAKALGFGPDALIRAIPDPKQKQEWKLPVKYWIHELYSKRFGKVLGEKPELPAPAALEYDEDAARRFEEQLYWEDYWERNGDSVRKNPGESTQRAAAGKVSAPVDPNWRPKEITDDDVPF
jgi:hypothetical protein